MSKRNAHVARLLDAHKAKTEESIAGRPMSDRARQADERLEFAGRNASQEEWDAFVGQSLDHTLGTGWRNGQ